MEAITFICTVCGAAALSRASSSSSNTWVGDVPVDKRLLYLYNIFIQKIQVYLM